MTNRPAPLPLGLGIPLAPLYAAAVARRNKRFDRGVGVKTSPVPVISVGNIAVGGVGKTPHVQLVARLLRSLGKRPGIILRGYGHKTNGHSDEHAEHKAHSPETPVVANPNRYEAVAQLLASAAGPRPDTVILDDGFQHRRLKRNLDLVLIDATRSPFNDRLLPAGWLREPVSSLARASAIILTHADLPSASALSALRADVERVTGAPPVAETKHAWARDIPALINQRETSKERAWLAGKKLLVTCAIGNPEPFVGQARTAGATVADSLLFRDHARLDAPAVARIIAAARAAHADAILCTAKDWAKLRHAPADKWPCPVLRPRVEIECIAGRDELTDLIARAVKAERKKNDAPEP